VGPGANRHCVGCEGGVTREELLFFRGGDVPGSQNSFTSDSGQDNLTSDSGQDSLASDSGQDTLTEAISQNVLTSTCQKRVGQ
jgi:hypothetical protein